jgi:hypothetical protein
MGLRREPPSQLEICQAVHDACFEYAQSDLPREPLAIAEWVHDRVTGGEVWETIYKVAEGGWRRNCILRFADLNVEVERLVARYDAGESLPNLRARLCESHP